MEEDRCDAAQRPRCGRAAASRTMTPSLDDAVHRRKATAELARPNCCVLGADRSWQVARVERRDDRVPGVATSQRGLRRPRRRSGGPRRPGSCPDVDPWRSGVSGVAPSPRTGSAKRIRCLRAAPRPGKGRERDTIEEQMVLWPGWQPGCER